MKFLKAASAIICAASVTMVFSPRAKAQELGDYNRKTTVTFSGPVEIPGVHLKGYSVLPAGTYVFKLMNSTVNRHIVQIFSADEKKIYATILAIPNTRVQRTDKTVITFRERPNGEPPALRAWWYPDAAWGDEFVYPKARAKEIAQATNTPVLGNSDESAPSEVGELQTPTASETSQMNSAPVVAYNPAGDETELSQAVTAPPDTQASIPQVSDTQASNYSNTSSTQALNNTNLQASNNTQPSDNTQAYNAAPSNMPSQSQAPSQLPQTGSQLFVIMLSGLVALVAAVGVRFMRRLVL
jgi:LPXTG-motif cell wall-anchored protein